MRTWLGREGSEDVVGEGGKWGRGWGVGAWLEIEGSGGVVREGGEWGRVWGVEGVAGERHRRGRFTK